MSTRTLPLSCLLALLCSANASAAATAGAPDPFTLPVERYQLPSGMTVLLHRDPALPQVVVSLWFDVGSKDEAPGRTGFAHLYEHLMFMGSQYVGQGEFDKIMEAEGGQNNATTSNDRTYYFDSGPAHLLPTLLWLEAERLTTLPATMTDEKVALQREVVRNERRQSYENRPYGQAELRLSDAMYPKGHPYSWPVIGSHADLLAARTADVKQFFYTYYAPGNATLCVAGDFDPKEARRLIDHDFGWMPKSPRPKKESPSAAVPERPVLTQLTLEDQVELPRLYLAWHAPPVGSAGAAETQLLADVLGTGKASRLYRALVFDKQLAQGVEVEFQPQLLGSLLVATVTARRGVRPAELQAATEAELARLFRQPITQEELERARNQRLTEWARTIETLLGRAEVLQTMLAFYGDPQALSGEVRRLRQLAPRDLMARAAALGLSQPARRLAITVVKGAPKAAPEAKAEAKPAKAPAGSGPAPAPPAGDPDMKAPFDLARRPALLPPRPFAAPRTARFRIGGLDVLLVQRRGAALVEAQVLVPAGSADVAPQAAGVPGAVAAMLTEGAGERSAQAVADELARLGATLKATVTPDSTTVSLEVMAERYPQAAPILFDVVARPTFPEADWKRVQAERITELSKDRAEPRYSAERGLHTALYGERHPYGLSPLGDEGILGRTTRDDLRAFHQAHYRKGRVLLLVAGDVKLTREEAERLAAPFALWPAAGASAAPATPAVPRGAAAGGAAAGAHRPPRRPAVGAAHRQPGTGAQEPRPHRPRTWATCCSAAPSPAG